MKNLLKKGIIFGAIYLILLLCTFLMSERIESLENNSKEDNSLPVKVAMAKDNN